MARSRISRNGVWSDHAQAHNDRLIARQEALAAAWKALAAENPADWENAWAERRRQALKDGGFQVRSSEA